jgi:phage terminase small subunit
MPILDNPRHERFCHELVRGQSQSAAYAAAGYEPTSASTAKASASRLAARPEIRARVTELTTNSAKRAELTRVEIITLLRQDHDEAFKRGHMSAAVRAAELLGKDIGMFVQRAEIKTSLLDEMSMEELDDLVRKLTQTDEAEPTQQPS